MTEDRPLEERVDRGNDSDADEPLTRQRARSERDVRALLAAASAVEHPDVFPGEPLS